MGKTIDDHVCAIRAAQAALNELLAEAAQDGIESRVDNVTFGGSLSGRPRQHEEVRIILEVKP